MRTPKDFRIIYHGIEHEQYFQGHGVSFTHWDDCVTGIGSSNREALDDALEQLACAGEWDAIGLEVMIREQSEFPTDKPDTGLDEGFWYHVSIDLK